MQNKDTNDFTLELDDQIQSLSDIINNPRTDTESKILIESMVTKDRQEHEGKDEVTIYLVKQLQKDCDDKVKKEGPEPFKYDENEFPPLIK